MIAPNKDANNCADRFPVGNTPLLTPPSMIMRNGNYVMDSRTNRNALLMNKMNPLAMRLSQFPPARIPSQFPGPRLAAPGQGLQPSLNMLCDVAVNEHIGGKRPSMDGKHDPSKRLKMDTSHHTPLSLKDNPVLLERLSALGGGFPMPKWGGAGKKTKTKTLETPKQLTSRIGAFPMPSLKGKVLKSASLTSYKSLWRNTEHELRKEILSRKLQRGHVKILSGTNSNQRL